MKSFKVLFWAFTLVLAGTTFFNPFMSTAEAGYNRADDYDVGVVYETNMVPFSIGIDITLTSTVRDSDKTITREAITAINKDNCKYPFSSGVYTDKIDYFRNGSLRTTHRPSTSFDVLRSSCWQVDANEAHPYSDMSSSYTYTATAYAVWTSSQTVPGSFLVDVQENQSID
ncbi:hypothetical protein JI666_15360 [Bacillus sp. NTK071]|uniref:hypothetical protein n=1 Tax=Bacillus sp. NTK071 TaxID=2802175 RepID=UPI001A8CB7C4|nr:hypothetical protein [Bacillus sp. NTK071]MBN8210131.1 hypothetical protein [Bacillus sp. NTK071]